ncbi:MAG: DotU family type IV/VI secretion system protein [Pirellulaceae bacterium]
MNPRFAAAVDPVFLHVLDLLERIGRNEAHAPDVERELIGNRFREAEAQIGEKQGWDLAKYALVAWIDDVLIAAPWEGRDWWENNSLEFAYFKSRDRATEFFQKAIRAAEMTRRDALEVFYVCVVLGFRGLYGLQDAAFMADQLQLPTDLNEWARRTSRSIQLGQGRPPISESIRPRTTAPPLEGKFLLVGTVLVSAVLSAFAIVIAYYLVWQA